MVIVLITPPAEDAFLKVRFIGHGAMAPSGRHSQRWHTGNAVPTSAVRPRAAYSHSMLAGGLVEMSKSTRLMPFTWLRISFEVAASTS